MVCEEVRAVVREVVLAVVCGVDFVVVREEDLVVE